MKELLPAVDIPLNIMLITPVFLLFFVGLILWTYRKKAKNTYSEIENLPFNDNLKKEK